MRVLVVDDTPESLYMLETLLKGHGYEVSTATNGAEALARIGEVAPALIVSDILMPKMDGFQLCRAVKADAALRDIPFVFYTATYTEGKDREFALGLGASRFVLKPADPDALVGIVKDVLAEASAGRPSPASVTLQGETEYLREHQARLIQKLEAKIAQLGRSEERYRSLSAELERRVQERTQELQVALRLADAANRAKTVFLASMSHELRTPLNAIIGFSEILQAPGDDVPPGKQAEYAAHIHRSGRHLLGLINDILDLAKVEAGKMELERTTFALRPALEFCLALMKERAHKRGLALSLDLAPEADCAIVADERKVKQILFNLLSNAVKFTNAGGSVRLTARKLDGARLELRVADTGIGIRQEDLPKLFQDFTQLPSPGGSAEEGTGLGLALTKRLVELHAGTIRAESRLGAGSTFTVVLPVGP